MTKPPLSEKEDIKFIPTQHEICHLDRAKIFIHAPATAAWWISWPNDAKCGSRYRGSARLCEALRQQHGPSASMLIKTSTRQNRRIALVLKSVMSIVISKDTLGTPFPHYEP